MRSGRYKLIEYFENGTVQLFDLENDMGERNDLAESQPEIARKLKKMLHDWREEVDAKMPYPKTATSKPAPGSRVARPGKNSLVADVATFAPGWMIKNGGGPSMKPGLRKEWGGRNNVLMTHPLSQHTPCVLFRSLEVPLGKTTALTLRVRDDNRGDFKLIVKANGNELLRKDIADNRWQDLRIDLSGYAGKTVQLEVLNQATGWKFEAAYWSRIAIESD